MIGIGLVQTEGKSSWITASDMRPRTCVGVRAARVYVCGALGRHVERRTKAPRKIHFIVDLPTAAATIVSACSSQISRGPIEAAARSEPTTSRGHADPCVAGRHESAAEGTVNPAVARPLLGVVTSPFVPRLGMAATAIGGGPAVVQTLSFSPGKQFTRAIATSSCGTLCR